MKRWRRFLAVIMTAGIVGGVLSVQPATAVDREIKCQVNAHQPWAIKNPAGTWLMRGFGNVQCNFEPDTYVMEVALVRHKVNSPVGVDTLTVNACAFAKPGGASMSNIPGGQTGDVGEECHLLYAFPHRPKFTWWWETVTTFYACEFYTGQPQPTCGGFERKSLPYFWPAGSTRWAEGATCVPAITGPSGPSDPTGYIPEPSGPSDPSGFDSPTEIC